MASFFSFPLVYFMLLFMMLISISFKLNVVADDEMMDQDELVALFEVMESLLEEQDWAQTHPLPCTETPWPGLECGVEMLESSDTSNITNGAKFQLFHVTKIHVGTDIQSQPCKPSATFSTSLIKLPYLKTLSIFNCFITHQVSLPSSIFNSFSSLEHISVVSNPSLVGQIPSTLSQLNNLKVLNLGQNNLQGTIPKEILKLTTLVQLDLSYNNLSGTIHEAIGELKTLRILNLCCNKLIGNIPHSIHNLQQLQKMDLSSNLLSGPLPQSIGHLSNLVLLDLTFNTISGPLPETFKDLTHLQYLMISNNPINSNIPNFIKSLTKLSTLSLSSCGFNGEIPTYFPSLTKLASLSLDNNRLNGTVPENLATLQNLNHLNLSFNELQGELQLSQQFVNRLGSRLDIEGNSGLVCHCGFQNSTNLQTPTGNRTNGHMVNEVNPLWSNQSCSTKVKVVVLFHLLIWSIFSHL